MGEGGFGRDGEQSGVGFGVLSLRYLLNIKMEIQAMIAGYINLKFRREV